MRPSGLALAGLCLVAADADAEPRFGIGLMAGEPTGLSLVTRLGSDRAVQAGLAWSFAENESFHLHADYVILDRGRIAPPELEHRAALYWGVGLRVKFRDDDGLGRNRDDTLVGIRLPLGVVWHAATTAVELFGELAPVFDVAPDTDLDIQLAAGVRRYF